MGRGNGRRFLLTLGTGRYRNLPDTEQLPQVPHDIAAVRELFRELGYEPALEGLGAYDSAESIRRRLSAWSTDVNLGPDDVVVLYHAGHGRVEPHDRHYLMCWDTVDDDLVATALPTEDLVRVLCRTGLRNLMVILDTCMAGAGNADALGVALKTIAYRNTGDARFGGLWFLASARRKDEAEDGAFVKVLRPAIDAVTARTGQRQRYLDLTELVNSINELLEAGGHGQRAELESALVRGLAPFLPNAGYREHLPPPGTDLEIQRRVSAQDVIEHFGPRSRGVEFESEQGLYFSGRERALTELVAWLTAPVGDGKGRVVTGNPGCGSGGRLIVATGRGVLALRVNVEEVA